MQDTLYKLLKGALVSVKIPEIEHEFYTAAKKMGYISFDSRGSGKAIAYMHMKITEKGLNYFNSIRSQYEQEDEKKPKGRIVEVKL